MVDEGATQVNVSVEFLGDLCGEIQVAFMNDSEDATGIPYSFVNRVSLHIDLCNLIFHHSSW